MFESILTYVRMKPLDIFNGIQEGVETSASLNPLDIFLWQITVRDRILVFVNYIFLTRRRDNFLRCLW